MPNRVKTLKALSFYITHTHTHLMALCPGLPGWAGTRKEKSICILLKQETVSGSGISGPYASLHLAPVRYPRQQPTTQFFTGRMPFLPPNQQRQSTECKQNMYKTGTKFYSNDSQLCAAITSLSHIAQTECTDATSCYRCSTVCVCECLGHNHERCWNGTTDQDTIWAVDSGGPKKPCIVGDWPQGKGNFLGRGTWVSEQFLYGKSAQKRPFQCH